MSIKKLLSVLALGSALWSAESRADTTVCVDVKLHEEELPKPAPAPEAETEVPGARRAPAPQRHSVMPSMLPLGQNPIDYLRRLLEHFVTHERGYQARQGDCQQTLSVELYPLVEGWTVFARYSGTGREERVDILYGDELSQFAERAVLALLYGKPISTTIKRDTVLRADSKRAMQRIRGTNHFTMHLGTELRGGYVPTAQADGTTADSIRIFSPMTLGLGYRGKFESWGIETTVSVGVGTSKIGLSENPAGGHIDYGGNLALSFHFLRYLNPRGLTSAYLGAGSTFEMLWLYSIQKSISGYQYRDTLISGGLDVDLLLGVEFMRASRAQFFLQGGLTLPAYVVDNEEDASKVRTWLPGVTLKLGMMF